MGCFFVNNINYQSELDKISEGLKISGIRPKLLLHSCCAPCSSYCLIYLREYFDITSFYYNPNISDESEYVKRFNELVRLANALNGESHPGADIEVVDGFYGSEEFFAAAKGLEREPERGARCTECFRLRLGKTAEYAAENGFDYFTTSLTISPLKNAALINSVGMAVAEQNGAVWLPSDFKKRGGYQQSIELSKKYNLYRQNYCGCDFSR